MSTKIFNADLEIQKSAGLTTPDAGYLTVAPKSDDNLYIKNSAGTESKVWTNTNDGSGSGLDADLLDGQHGSYYAPATHYHDDRYSLLGHTHDSRYYTETEINNLLSNYQPLDSDLTAIAALTGTGYLYRNAITGWSLETISGGDSYTGWELNGSVIEGINAGNDKFRNVTIQGVGAGISVSDGTGDSGTYWTKIINIQNTAPFPGFGTTSSTAARGNHTHTIDSLSNVTISSPATNSLLAYNGSAWVNKTAAELGLGGGGSSYNWSLNSIDVPVTDSSHAGVFLNAGTGMNVNVQDMREANPAYISAVISAKRSFTWVIQNPTPGSGVYILGPKTLEGCTITNITACVSSATSVTFNIQKRTSPNTAGVNVRSTNMVAPTSNTGSWTPTSSNVVAGQYLVLMLISKSGTPAQLSVTVSVE